MGNGIVKITSAGVIRNAEKPRIGITNCNSLAEFAIDEIYGPNHIDLTFEELCQGLRDEGIEEDSEEWDKRLMYADCESRVILFGSWKKDENGKYVPDTNGIFAAIFNSESNNVAVQWSKYTTPCHHTSPCYQMADGSGPCGDLDTPGDSVIAYTLPAAFFRKDENE